MTETRQLDDSTPPGGWPKPRAAYLHVPFCRHRCGYCNFSVISGRDDLVDRFLNAIDSELATLQRPTVDSIFLGGGTPTHLSRDQLSQFLQMTRDRFDLATGIEFSIEANPEDVDQDKLGVLKEFGVNRVSLGVQSFQNEKLRTLERGHSGEAACEAVSQVAEVIPNVSLDLIFAAPGETLEQWKRDLEIATELPIQHLSTYSLTYEKGTSFWSRRESGQITEQSESSEIAMYNAARETAANAGLEHYEISSFARPGMRCQHNHVYWRGAGWFAAGPGAARFVDGVRETNHRSTTTYLKRIESSLDPTAEREVISVLEHARERAAFGVRMIEGIDLDAISQSTGCNLRSELDKPISLSLDDGFLEEVGGRLRLTEPGVLYADTVARRLLFE